MTKITSRDQFLDRLNELPHDVCIQIAARSGLRVFPMAASYQDPTTLSYPLALATARTILTAWVGSFEASPEIRHAAEIASNISRTACRENGIAPASAYATDSGNCSARGVIGSYFGNNNTCAGADAAVDAADAVDGTPAIQGANYEATFKDSELVEVPIIGKLWNEKGMAPDLIPYWQRLQNMFSEDANWSFWREWYQGFLDGKPLDWELQKEIALIPDADWQKGPEWIAGLIEIIRLKYRTATAPRLVRSDIDAVFHVEAEDALAQDVLEFSCERIETALQNALASSGANGLLEDSYETIVIRRALDSHQERASLLATGFYDACLSFQRNIGDRYPDDTALINLQNALYGVVEEINEQHEDARKRCARLASLAQPEPITAQDRSELVLVPEFLEAELDSDARKIVESDVEHILTQERPAKSVRSRFTNWVTTVSLWMDKAMKGDKRARWLAGIVSRLVRWWSGSDQDEE